MHAPILTKLVGLGSHLPQWLRAALITLARLASRVYAVAKTIAYKKQSGMALAVNATAAVMESAAHSTVLQSVAPSLPSQTFTEAIDLERGSVMMIGTSDVTERRTEHDSDKLSAGDKRTADQSGINDDAIDNEPADDDESTPWVNEQALLVQAVQAMQAWVGERDIVHISSNQWSSAWTNDNVTVALTMLAPLVGVYRVQKGTLSAIGTALTRRIWNVGSVVEACKLLNSGKGISNIRRHAASLTKVLEKLGGHGTGSADDSMAWVVDQATNATSNMYGVWNRHMHYVLNKPGPLPPYPTRRMHEDAMLR